MAVLSDADRELVRGTFCNQIRDYDIGQIAGLVKADVRAAVNALDQFLDDNATAINQAIPQPARGALTTKQKALLLQFVISQRYLRA